MKKKRNHYRICLAKTKVLANLNLLSLSRPKPKLAKSDVVPHHALPKMYFPKFDGSHPKIWIDNCKNYFSIYAMPERV
jgi:hypothetical protein